jgi:hypothetical protein
LGIESLRGVRGVGIVINDPGELPGVVPQAEFRKDAYFFFESALQTAGVPTLPSVEEIALVPGHPFLAVTVDFVAEEEASLLAFVTRTSLYQTVTLKNIPEDTTAVTWERLSLGLAAPDGFWQTVAAMLRHHVTLFIQDYQTSQANPA